MLTKIISGGQTGADHGALVGALSADLLAGGTAPKGWITERGQQAALLQGFGLVECRRAGYPARTRANVQDSDGTLIIGNPRLHSRGSRLTMRYCFELRKQFLTVGWRSGLSSLTDMARICAWIREHDIEILNVAGNRESRNPGIFAETCRLINSIARELCE